VVREVFSLHFNSALDTKGRGVTVWDRSHHGIV